MESATSWFAARPSGTENVYKIYAESFAGPEQLATVQAPAVHVALALRRSQTLAHAPQFAGLPDVWTSHPVAAIPSQLA